MKIDWWCVCNGATAAHTAKTNFGNDNKRYYLVELRQVQAEAQNGDGFGLVASVSELTTTDFGWNYYNRLQIDTAAWFILAEQRYNPFIGEFINHAPLPVADHYTVTEDTQLIVNGQEGVLENDGDPEDNELTAGVIAYPAYCELDLTPAERSLLRRSSTTSVAMRKPTRPATSSTPAPQRW